ncbi:hypothetical protein AB8U03_01795 [Clostridium sp. Mt-5]|uniref:Lipoprotein n=1 Tax=Clostridium moutaii TaxID=3240932 RepID=A0ABV4BL17_9CLOT
MRKNFYIIITSLLIIINLAGCGTQQQSNNVKNKVQNIENKTKNDLVELPKALKTDMGPGKFYISSSSNTFKDGNIPIINIKKNTSSQKVEIVPSEFNNKYLSYIFIDGIFNSRKQLSNNKTNIELKGNDIKAGKHKIDIIQFNNNKTTDTVLTHKISYYYINIV